MENKTHSAACERNRVPILDKLKHYFAGQHSVLEIGSGTGQHAVFLGAHLPHLEWHTSDRTENHASINAWLQEASLKNVHSPFHLDVNQDWPRRNFDAAFSANTCHIMSWEEVKKMFRGLSACLNDGGIFVLYGPFNYGGQYTCPSNRAFDESLRAQAKHMGIRDFDAIKELASMNHFIIVNDDEMPANNRLLVFKKTTNPL